MQILILILCISGTRKLAESLPKVLLTSCCSLEKHSSASSTSLSAYDLPKILSLMAVALLGQDLSKIFTEPSNDFDDSLSFSQTPEEFDLEPSLNDEKILKSFSLSPISKSPLVHYEVETENETVTELKYMVPTETEAPWVDQTNTDSKNMVTPTTSPPQGLTNAKETVNKTYNKL